MRPHKYQISGERIDKKMKCLSPHTPFSMSHFDDDRVSLVQSAQSELFAQYEAEFRENRDSLIALLKSLTSGDEEDTSTDGLGFCLHSLSLSLSLSLEISTGIISMQRREE